LACSGGDGGEIEPGKVDAAGEWGEYHTMVGKEKTLPHSLSCLSEHSFSYPHLLYHYWGSCMFHAWQILDGPLFKTHRLQEEGSPKLYTSDDGTYLLLDFSTIKLVQK